MAKEKERKGSKSTGATAKEAAAERDPVDGGSPTRDAPGYTVLARRYRSQELRRS
jgi:hypothetical protein